MIIVHDSRTILGPDGLALGTETHSIDTSNPAVITMLTDLSGNPAAQLQAGYHEPSGLGGTRWSQVVRAANDPSADSNIKAIGVH